MDQKAIPTGTYGPGCRTRRVELSSVHWCIHRFVGFNFSEFLGLRADITTLFTLLFGVVQTRVTGWLFSPITANI